MYEFILTFAEVSLDDFMAGPNGELDWLVSTMMNEECHRSRKHDGHWPPLRTHQA
jgi:hypothetical protein